MKKQQAYRHGEILLLKIDKLPKVLKETKTNLIEQGSHNNAHTFTGGKIYFKKENDFVFGYLKAENTKLFHPEHGKKSGEKIKDGFYKLIKQQEYTPQGLVPVID